MDGYERLKNAIVQQAAEDYAAAFMGNPVGGKDADGMMRECEAFFRSEWYEQLVNGAVNGEWLVRNLKIRELEKAAKAYEAMLEPCNKTTLKAAVNFPKDGNMEKPKPMTYVFPPKLAEALMNALQIQYECIRAEIRELKNEEVDL